MIGRRVPISKTGLSICSSSRRICRVIAGCVRHNLRAASVTLPVSTTETKVRSDLMSRCPTGMVISPAYAAYRSRTALP